MRGKDAPSDRKKILKMSLQVRWGPGLELPKRTTGGLTATLSGSHLAHMSVAARTTSHLPPKVGRR